MTEVPRKFVYRWIGALREQTRGDANQLLAGIIDAMRGLRGLPPVCAQSCEMRTIESHLDDPQVCQLLRQDDALGIIYQAINASVLQRAYRESARDRRKFRRNEIPAVTQLFTPRWVVEFLLHNTLGRLWIEIHPDSILRPKLKYLVENRDEPVRPRAAQSMTAVRELRIIDPASGTMNFGVVAIELLEMMYREELDRAGRSGWPAEPSVGCESQIPRSIASRNLLGIDIDPLALQLAKATLRMKLREEVDLHLWRGDALFDRAIGRRATGAFDVVVTNPPFLAARNMPGPMVRRLKCKYPRAWRDAYACFIERCLDFAKPDGGRVGLLTMQSFMFTGAFERLRRHLFDTACIEAIAHFGPGLFDIGNPGTLQTVATVLRRESRELVRGSQPITAFRLVETEQKREAIASQISHHISQSEMSSSARAAWVYWLSQPERQIFATFPRLADVAPPRQGLATTDNAHFVRYWWEVTPTTPDAPRLATPGKWHPYAKGGRFRRWYQAPRHRVDWLDDGAAIKQSIIDRYPYLNGQWQWVAKNSSYYGRAGVTYSYLTSGRFSARRLKSGCIFDVAGSSLFPEDPLTMLAVLNSSITRRLLGAINPTVNFQVGDLAQIPVPRHGTDQLRQDVSQAIELQRQLDRGDQTSPDFLAPPDWNSPGLSALPELERRIDRQVAELYGLAESAMDAEIEPKSIEQTDLARRWVSFVVRRILQDREIIQVRPIDDTTVGLVRSELQSRLGCAAAGAIDGAVGGIGHFLAGDLFGWIVRLYQRRPPIWMLGDSDRAHLVLHDHATPQLIEQIVAPVPRGWDRFIDDGMVVNLAPLWRCVPDATMQKLLRQIDADLQTGRLEWSQTCQNISRARIGGSAAFRACRPRRRSGRSQTIPAAART